MSLQHTATWREIQGQPDLWDALSRSPALRDARDWIAMLAAKEVWLCGAGSSALLGEIVATALDGVIHPRLRALPTTDLVARPRAFLPTKALVIQFSRSGDTAESVATLDALDALSPETARLHVTCNAAGTLATRAPKTHPDPRLRPAPFHVLTLPEAAHDAGFAMTGSFTAMLLTALALLAPEGAQPIPEHAAHLRRLLPLYEDAARAARTPERLVFLGTGPLQPAARECALKVTELTAGMIPAVWDTPLGFRHGPRAALRGAADVVLLRSPDRHAALYEDDLAAELRATHPETRVLTLGPGGDLDVPMPDGAEWGAALVVPFAQVLAATLADRLGLPVDDPFAGQGTLTRVVQGLRLHKVKP
ncbi:SIS domain-containing protein [Rubellimicrobium aerolatum]|uniref:SIS domain-containing protein n=1 Tax=Rubellimicrobium aerolatum TaxID=490979 RepID=A0ABW0SG21_9RHOB|nr:SIS domain-containing protein [Rubellimicrobium aerolatum]MBP1805821.1 tagatose-6-phosphate ketose/aldose isomerase [Rubellimicrobium aerolatum]